MIKSYQTFKLIYLNIQVNCVYMTISIFKSIVSI